MNTDTLKAYWKEAKGEAKKQWGKLSDDDLNVIDGDIDKLSGTLQKYYSYTKEEAKDKVEEFKNNYEKQKKANESLKAKDSSGDPSDPTVLGMCGQPRDPNHDPDDSTIMGRAGQAARKIGDFGKDFYEETKEMAEHLKNDAQEYQKAVVDFIDKKPYQSLAIAALGGVVLGLLFRKK